MPVVVALKRAELMDVSEFYKMEYESLREEILARQAARRNLEQVGAGLIAALYAWLTTTGAKEGAPLADLAWWVPPAIAFGVAWRGNSLSEGIRKAGRYLVTVEQEILGTDVAGPKGWHVKLATDRAEKAKKDEEDKKKTWLRRCKAWLSKHAARMFRKNKQPDDSVDSEKNKTNMTWYVVALVTSAIAVLASLQDDWWRGVFPAC